MMGTRQNRLAAAVLTYIPTMNVLSKNIKNIYIFNDFFSTAKNWRVFVIHVHSLNQNVVNVVIMSAST